MKILFAGEGGQGIQAVAEILAKAAFDEGKFASYIPNFGVEQRGGVSLAFVIVSETQIDYPKFEKADILAIFSDRSKERVLQYIQKKTKIIYGTAITDSSQLPKVSIAFNLRGWLGTTPRVWNVLVLGKINEVGKIVSQESLIKAMNERFSKQFKLNPELKKLNLEALCQFK